MPALAHLPQLELKIQQNDRWVVGKSLSICELKKSVFSKPHVVKKTPLQLTRG
jgi:hypothetical protein